MNRNLKHIATLALITSLIVFLVACDSLFGPDDDKSTPEIAIAGDYHFPGGLTEADGGEQILTGNYWRVSNTELLEFPPDAEGGMDAEPPVEHDILFFDNQTRVLIKQFRKLPSGSGPFDMFQKTKWVIQDDGTLAITNYRVLNTEAEARADEQVNNTGTGIPVP